MRIFLTCIIALLSFSVLSAQNDIIGPDTYPDGVNPLTGLAVEDPSILDRRPFMVKVINAPAEVRPQAGLMYADIVWETLIAGGMTRFSAIYYSQDIDFLGPIRSARLSDFELLRIYRATLVYSGMSDGTLNIFLNDNFLIPRAFGGTSPCPALCRYPEQSDKLEWTLFGDTSAMREVAVERDKLTDYEPIFGMAFSEDAPDRGFVTDSITLDYVATSVKWDYDADTTLWLRSQDGEPHIEALTMEQITSANVLIVEEDHIDQPFVSEGYWGPGNYAYSINFIGSGRAILLRDGQYYEGEWRRDTQDDVLFYIDGNEDPLIFKPGNTFVQLVPRWVGGYRLTFDSSNQLTATITTGSANIRKGPTGNFPVGAAGTRGEEYPAIGRNNTGDWIQIRVADDVLWVSTIVAEVDGDIMSLPLVRPTIEN
jgi:hypothetical protein